MGESGDVFPDLPEALVDELLLRCGGVGEYLSRSFHRVNDERVAIREGLRDLGILHRDSEVSSFPMNPTCCGVDGSYAVERLLSTDLAVAAAVAVEGLTPPVEARFWTQPRHRCEVRAVPHSDGTVSVLRGVMMCMEMVLLGEAPHDVVMLDGSMTTPLIYVNQALSVIEDSPGMLRDVLYDLVDDAVRSVLVMVQSERSDRIYVAAPKYTTRRELAEMIGFPEYEDRGLLSFVLEAGQFVGPLQTPVGSRLWEIERISDEYRGFVSSYMKQIRDLKIIYYRPFEHVPALRLEVANSVARNPQRLALLFEAVRIQCGAPSIFEPYPLYMADRMVKHLGRAIPALRRSTTQSIAEGWEGGLGPMFLAMHGYRTESGM